MTLYKDTFLKVGIKKPVPNETQAQAKLRRKRNQLIRHYSDYKCLWYIVLPCPDIESAEATLEMIYDAGWMSREQYSAWQECSPMYKTRGFVEPTSKEHKKRIREMKKKIFR